jgi:hypothetical protein
MGMTMGFMDAFICFRSPTLPMRLRVSRTSRQSKAFSTPGFDRSGDWTNGELFSLTSPQTLTLSRGDSDNWVPAPVTTGLIYPAYVGGSDPLSFRLSGDGPSLALARFDRLLVEWNIQDCQVVLGRQPITLGHMRIFTPFDLAAPFAPVTLDREWKAGVDGARIDAFFSRDGWLRAAVFTQGAKWPAQGSALVFGSTLLGPVEVEGLAALFHEGPVVGLGLATELMGVSFRGEGTWSSPADTSAHFRFAAGLSGQLWLFHGFVEYYHQSFFDEGFLTAAVSRIDVSLAHPELFLRNRHYVSVLINWVGTPLMHIDAQVLSHIDDGSHVLASSIWLTPSDNIELRISLVTPYQLPQPDDWVETEFAGLPSSVSVQSKFIF